MKSKYKCQVKKTQLNAASANRENDCHGDGSKAVLDTIMHISIVAWGLSCYRDLYNDSYKLPGAVSFE